jgi:hypothetical protein
MTAIAINVMLKAMCWFHDISSKIPPHEQGTNELKFRMM